MVSAVRTNVLYIDAHGRPLNTLQSWQQAAEMAHGLLDRERTAPPFFCETPVLL